jgi:hypothetical protein
VQEAVLLAKQIEDGGYDGAHSRGRDQQIPQDKGADAKKQQEQDQEDGGKLLREFHFFSFELLHSTG